jgi:class 3 adenylate cyclase
MIAPVRAWLAGQEPDPFQVWLSLRDMPNRFVQRVYGTSVTAVIIVGVASFDRLSDVSPRGVVLTTLVACGAGAVGGVILSVAIELGIRPITEEVSAALPPDHELDDATWSIRTRIALGAAMVAYSTGLLTASITAQGEGPDDRFLLAVIGTAGAGIFATTVFHIGISQPLLRPLRDLLEGTRRVRIGDFSRPLPVTTSDELGQLAMSFNAMQSGLQERAALHAAFGTYVDPGLTQRLLEVGDSALAAELVEVTVFFIDVMGFTTYAASVEPEVAVGRLNELFEVVVPIVREHRGHPNRYLGDGLLAVFGAPEPIEDHAERAVAAAIEIQAAVRERFGRALRVGVGINSGKVIAGAIGGGGKLEYTVIGDVVNVAARVEELTREIGDSILLTDATAAALPTSVKLADAGRHAVRGRPDPVQLHSVAARRRRTT